MLIIKQGLLEKMQILANELYPIEACGIVAAPVGGAVAERLIAMRNALDSEHYFRFETKEHLSVWRELERHDEECRVIYHSHTQSIPYPSAEDIQFATDPSVHYVIISTWPQAPDDIRSFRIIEGHVTEESIVITA